MVPISHYIFSLVMLPVPEMLLLLFDHLPRQRIIRLLDEFLDVVSLQSHTLQRIVELHSPIFELAPLTTVLRHLVPRGQLLAPQDHISQVPGLRIEHGEREELILHPHVRQLRISLPHHTLIQSQRPNSVVGFEAQIVSQEWEVMAVASAENNGVDIQLRFVPEVAGLSIGIHPLEERHFLPLLLRPFDPRGLAAVAQSDGLRTEFVALRSDVFRRVAPADD
ncbi:hypothetical protein Mapa_002635 [Marchantia paleacea]|nr:hypothetical protein Mapa_002635 [Marchantia paleacea]